MIPAITEVNFPSYATLHQASVSLQDMGDRVITTQVRIDGDVVPDFSGWELRFKGERFVLPSDNPQASKDNTTRNSVVDLQFQSWAIQELKRYYFFEAASVSAGVAIADKYIAPVKLNIEDFVAMLNQVLQYYFGGKIVADLYLSGTGIYSQEPKIVDINYSYLWDVIGKIFEIYGVRNRIEYNATSDVYTIKINYPAPEISDHDFEYGYQGGLLKFERQVQDESLSNILLGRGGEKNLPYRYFKKADPQNPEWAADPDAIPELANIYFDRLRDINFRWYVRGWMHNPNRDTSGDEAWDPGHVFPTYTISSSSPYYWAYQKGLTDEVFAPVEYVKDDASIEAYGEHWGALDNNDDVYPTIQGLSRAGVGRIDEVVAVSPIVTDDIDAMSKAAALEKSINPLLVSYPRSNNDSPILSENFEIPSGQTGNITYAWVGPTNGTGIHVDTTQSTIVAVDSAGNEHSISGLSAGTYRLKLVISLYVPSGATASGTFGIENIKLTLSAQDADAWKPTFDIWVKDIWNTTREQGETDEAYSERVWGPILGDRAGNEAKVVFSTGFMAASEDYEFVIASYPVPDTSKSIGGVQSAWRITLRKSDAEFDATGLYIPNATTGGKPVAGDKFFFVGIDMPHLYVVMGEEGLNTVKSGDLQDSAAVNPTWVISLDKVRANTLEAGEYGQTLADRLAAGAKLRVTDPRFSGGDVLILHAQSITYTWNEPTDDNPYIVPDIEVVLSDKVVSRESRQDKIESSVEQIRAQYARLDDVEAVVRKVSEPLFLKKTGESDSSASPTQFSSKVSSKGFRQGGVGGTGWGFYRDNTAEFADGEIGEGDTVLEVDRMVVRKEMQVNSLVVNQVEYRGGMEVISAAKIEISKVVETPTRYVCYFDQRKNSVANNFQVGDIAYGQVFSPQNVTVRYYKCKVEAVDVDRVELSKTIKDGSGIPQAGDIIVQYGSYTNAARQYVIVRDVVGGGYERMLSGLNAVDATGEEYYFAGRQSGNGPRWFVGGHGANDDYAEFANGVLTIKANVVFKPGQVIPGLEDYEYLKTALPLDEDATLIQGGLILSKTIALTDANGNIKAGINGLTTLGDIAAWYGGPMVDHEATPAASAFAKSLFRFDGSGYLAGGNIHWGADGYGGIPGVTWSRENDQDVITIGGNVRLASVDGDTVTSILQTIQALPTTYVDFVSNQTITGVKTFTNGIKIGVGDPILTWDSVNEAWHLSGNFYADGFVSAGGVSDTGGSTGIDLAAMWASLQNTSAEHTYDNTKIAGAHIPDVASVYGYLKQADIDPILALIPAQASSTNQLADKAFVNSSIATATATYRGNYNEYSDLGLQPSATHAQVATALASEISGADANDYCFVEIPTSASDPTQIERTERYKYNGTGWEYEYTLNNSGFTAVQWAAINSNITAGKVSTYDTVAGYFDANGKLGTSHLPALYIGNAQVQTSAQTAQNVGGLGNVTMGFNKTLNMQDDAASPNSINALQFYKTTGSSTTYILRLGGGMTAADRRTMINGGAEVRIQTGRSTSTTHIAFQENGDGVKSTRLYSYLSLPNAAPLYMYDNPTDGTNSSAREVLYLSNTNYLRLGYATATKGYATRIHGSLINFYTAAAGGTQTVRMQITAAGNIETYGDIRPHTPDAYDLGSESAFFAEAYAKKVYLAANTYIEVDSNGYVHLVTPSGKGFYCDGFVSAGGISSGGGGGSTQYLNDLLDVAITNPAPNEILRYNGSAWVNSEEADLDIATPSSPATPDQNVTYMVSEAGTYNNFGGLVVNEGELALMKFVNGGWTKQSTGAGSADWQTAHEWLARNTVKAVWSGGILNFDDTTHKVSIPALYFADPTQASGRKVVPAQQIDYDFAVTTTNAYMLYYDLDTDAYAWKATTATITEKMIPIAALLISGQSTTTGAVRAITWSIIKDARVNNEGDVTKLAEIDEIADLIGEEEVVFDPIAVIRGTIYNGNVNTNVTNTLYCPDFVRVKPGMTITLHHGAGITLRVTEYDKDKTYVRNTGTHADLSELTLGATTEYVRISAEYPAATVPADYHTGDFGFSYKGASCVNDNARVPIEKYQEAKWWIDGSQWRECNYNYGAIIFPVSGAKSLTMTAGTDVNARVAFANTYNPSTITEYDAIDGIGNQGCAPGVTRTLDIPSTCQYIVLSCRYTWGASPAYDASAKPNALPVSLIIDGKEYMKSLDDAVSDLTIRVQDTPDENGGGLNVIGRNIGKDAAVRATGVKVATAYQTDTYKPISFIHVSDIHTRGDNYKCFVNAMKYLQHYSNIQFAIVTGDLVWDNYADAMTWYDLGVAETTKPVLNVAGNHDAGQQNGSNPSLNYVTSDLQLYNKIIAPYVSNWGVTQPSGASTSGKSYYYKDFADEKIRLIVLNEFETDYQIDPNNPNQLLYSREFRAVHQAQVDWLISTLTATPNDFGVVVAYHQPDDNIADDGNAFVSCDLVGRQLASIYSSTRDWLPRILNAFRNKTALNFSFSQTGGVVGTINVVCDFTQSTAEFICILNGHTHRDIIGKMTAYPDLLVLCVGADNLLYTSNFCPRAEGTPSEDLFNVVNIDRNRHTIKVIRIGADASITGQIRDQLTVTY